MVSKFKLNQLVITPFKNRLGYECAGDIIKINNDNTYNILVYNLYGPGANMEIIDIPAAVLTDREYTNGQ